MTPEPPIPPSSSVPNVMAALQLQGGPGRAQLLEATEAEIHAAGFEVDEEVACGGSAIVFKGRERRTGRRVIIKVLKGPEHQRRFDREKRILAGNDLPSGLAPTLYRSIEGPGLQPCLVMEQIRGVKIHDYVRSPQPLELVARVRLLEGLFRCLDRLHEEGNVAHGDLSSNNVLTEPGGVLRLIDFGEGNPLVAGMNTLHTTNHHGSTDGFASEEARKGGRRTRADDIHGAGAVALHVLTDTVPSRESGSSKWSDCKRRLGSDARVPRGVRKIVLRALREPDARLKDDPRCYARARAVADDLHRWLESRRQRRLFLRHAAAAAVLILCVGCCAAYFWWKAHAAGQEFDRRNWEEIHAQVRQLGNADHPAVAGLRDEAERLRAAWDRESRQGFFGPGRSLQGALAVLRRALATGRDLERAAPLHRALGEVLRQLECAPEADVLRAKKTRLEQDYGAVARRLERGEVETAWTDLGSLQHALVALHKEDEDAKKAADLLTRYERLKSGVSERVQSLSEFALIDRLARDGRQAWLHGKWGEASLSFSLAQKQLDEWLEKVETPDEKVARQKTGREQFELLEAEYRKLQIRAAAAAAERDRADEQVRKLERQVAAANEEQKGVRLELVAAQKALGERTTSLEDTKKRLATSVAQAEGLGKELGAKKASLDALKKEVSQLRDEASRAERDKPPQPVPDPNRAVGNLVGRWEAYPLNNPRGVTRVEFGPGGACERKSADWKTVPPDGLDYEVKAEGNHKYLIISDLSRKLERKPSIRMRGDIVWLDRDHFSLQLYDGDDITEADTKTTFLYVRQPSPR